MAATIAAPLAVAQAEGTPPHQHQQEQMPMPEKRSDSQRQTPEHQQDMQHMEGMNHGGAMDGDINSSEMFLMNESTGTGSQPSAWPMPMLMTRASNWHLMWMAQAFVVETQQSGPRGGDKLYSSNWGMLGAMHKVAGGSLMLRSMLSLEPATVTNRRYPLLFQTGETAY